MFRTTVLFAAVLLSIPVFAEASTPRLKWAYETQGKIYAAPILADVTGDGRLEVIAAASRDSRLLCLDAAGELVWAYTLDDGGSDGIQAAPSAADLNGDGRLEVVFVTRRGVVTCLDNTGGLLWRRYLGDDVDYSGVVIADLTGDARPELVIGAESGMLYCLDDTGIPLWQFRGEGAVRGIPAVAHHPASNTCRIYVTFSGGAVVCLDSEGKPVWQHDEPGPRGERRYGAAVGDVTGDGRLDVVTGTEDFQVVVYDAESGEEKWRWKGQHQNDQTGSFALADFDGSGQLDVLAGDGRGLGGPGNVYRLRDGGAVWTADVGGGVVQGPSVADVDGDGALDVLLSNRSARLVCLSKDGVEKWSFPTGAGSLTTPAIGDLDGDGTVEVVFASKDRFIYCVTVDGAYDADRMPWPMINHDPQLSGNYHGAPLPERRAAEGAGGVFALDGVQFGPLATGVNRIAFTFGNPSQHPRRVEARARLDGPDGFRATYTATRRLEPGQVEEGELTAETLLDGEYKLSVEVLDAGAGERFAEHQDQLSFVPFAAERAEAEARMARIESHLAGLPSAALQTRARNALEQAGVWAQTMLQGLNSEAARALGSGAVSRDRLADAREALEAVRAILDRLERIEARLAVAAATQDGARDFGAVTDSPMAKVFRDEPYPVQHTASGPAQIQLARNEYEGVQVVVVPLWQNLENLRVTVDSLTHDSGGGRIPAEQVEVHRVGYVTIGQPEYEWRVEKIGDYPDILFPDVAVDVPAEQDAQPFFVTVYADADTPAGVYHGAIQIEADGLEPVLIPLEVEVWDFTLPEAVTLKTSFWFNETWLQHFYGYEGRVPFEVRKRYYDFHLARRVGPLKSLPLNGGERLDDVEYVMANGQNNIFVQVPHGLATDEARAAYAGQVRRAKEIVDARGWGGKVMFYSWDEIAVMARHQFAEFREVNHWLRTVMPEWPILQTSAPELGLFNAVDIWCPTIDVFDPHIVRDRMERGEKLWFYTVWGRPGIMIEFPATDYRLMFWQTWKYGAEGFLYWGTTHWDLNTQGEERWPDVPWITYHRQAGRNGCGYLIYPGPDGTPLGSVRFDIVRDGIEDYEYLHMLRELLEAAGPDIPGELRQRAELALEIDPQVLVDHKIYTEEPGAIYAARAGLAGLITELQAHLER